MATKVGKTARAELTAAVGGRYRSSSKEEKGRILDEFAAVTGFHRKHAIRILNGVDEPPVVKRQARRVYDEAVREALVVLWEAADRVCGKRLKPLLPILVSAMERHGHMVLHENVRDRLLEASAATIDRLLAEPRAVARGSKRLRRATPAIRASVPVRTFADWNEPAPGFLEIDLVAHCGGNQSGSYINTLTLTDIASGWTECLVLLVRDGALVVSALSGVRTAMPFPMRGVDSDNGSEFINEGVIAFCREHGIEFTRSRPYRKNDQAWVEQKNGAVVRRMVGYGRLEGLKAADVLTRMYDASRLYVNFFQPSFRLAEKKREGARVTKRYHAPATPCDRLLASNSIPAAVKDRLRGLAEQLDPLRLLDEIRTAQECLASLADGEAAHLASDRVVDLQQFLKGLATAWKTGEVRHTHIGKPRSARTWRTRKDPLESVWPQIEAWLQDDPDRTAKDLYQRLRRDFPNEFPDNQQMRTLQRRVREWRGTMARRLVFAADASTGGPT